MIQLDALCYRFARSAEWTLSGLSGTIACGEKLAVIGPSGCGKSTVARLLVGLLPRGNGDRRAGLLQLDGHDPTTLCASERVARFGYVGQNPTDQLVGESVGEELRFGLYRSAMTEAERAARVREVLDLVGLSFAEDRSTQHLSGGEAQRLVIAAALVASPAALILDEPLSQLDPIGVIQLLQTLDSLAKTGVTVILIEHRLQRVLPWSDRVLALRAGQGVFWDDTRHLHLSTFEAAGLCPPEGLLLRETLGTEGLNSWGWPGPSFPYRWGGASSAPNVAPPAPSVAPGECVAIIGVNGSGKTTYLKALHRSLPVDSAVFVPQDPDLSLFWRTVEEELRDGRPVSFGTLAESFGLDGLLHRSPHELSRGQRLRVAVAAALNVQRAVLLVDEPTAGQDGEQVRRVFERITGALGADRALVFATHDWSLAVRFATRICLLRAGRCVYNGPVGGLLSALNASERAGLPPVLALCDRLGAPALSLASLSEGLVR